MNDWTLQWPATTAALEAWEQLDAGFPRNPFLTHDWFVCLSAAGGDRVRPEPVQIKATDGRAWIATLHRARTRRSRAIPVRGLYLNETGQPELDRLTLEHNGLAGDASQEPEALRALLCDLLARDGHWDELVLGWVAGDYWAMLEPALAGLGLHSEIVDSRPFHFVDLRFLDGLEGYLAELSRNARYQIRRAMRGYGGEADLVVETATQADQALEWFRSLVDWHQSEWNARGRPGAFASRFMRAFHECLIARGTSTGLTRMLRVRGPSGPIGYLYNLAAGSYVCNYQSGFRYSEDPKLKPGLVCHTLAIGQAAAEGLERYDLLMGDSQYKRSLANGRGEMLQVRLQRPRWRFRLERGLRRLLRR